MVDGASVTQQYEEQTRKNLATVEQMGIHYAHRGGTKMKSWSTGRFGTLTATYELLSGHDLCRQSRHCVGTTENPSADWNSHGVSLSARIDENSNDAMKLEA